MLIWTSSANGFVELALERNGIGFRTSQQVGAFSASAIVDYTQLISPPNVVYITEYGNVNGFISGSFNITLMGGAPANLIYRVNGSFRVRRGL